MNEQKNNGRGIFYGVIGVATLVVAIIGATFAYFTATASNNIITGNMATVKLNLSVEKVTQVDVDKGGMIPMSNGMIEAAVNRGYTETVLEGDTDKDGTCSTEETQAGCKSSEVTNICVDDNGNAVCQIYKIIITNSSSAGQFVDGYVALRGGSGEPADLELTAKSGDTPAVNYTYKPEAMVDATRATTTYGTTMRWAQVFETAETNDNKFTTKGDQVLGTASEKVSFSGTLGSESDPLALENIRTQYKLQAAASNLTGFTVDANEGVLSELSIANTYYPVIGTNYIRLSDHKWGDGTAAETYDRSADITSALVFNHSIPANKGATYYIVVWLSETGTDQTAGETVGSITNPGAANFFVGDVTFKSAQGSEVSATFSSYARVPAKPATQQAG